MTCADFRDLSSRRPFYQSTRSERLAGTEHYHACEPCRTWLTVREDEEEPLTEEESALVDRMIELDNSVLDPEAP